MDMSGKFDFKPDYEISKQRFDAFWIHELVDRPLVQFRLYKPKPQRIRLPGRKRFYTKETWADADFQAKRHFVDLSNQLFLGDSLPVVCPSLGLASLPTFYGCSLYINRDGTSWNGTLNVNFNNLDWLSFDWESPWLSRTRKLVKACLHIGADHFITGMSNWLVGADCLASIIGYQKFAAALIQEPDWVRQALDRLWLDFKRLYLEFHAELNLAGQPGTTWVPLLSNGKYYIITNDFSASISASMYRKFFLEEVIRECQFLDHSIYHLDGPDALRHLNTILEVENLDGIHFIPPPTDATFNRWADVYKRIQEAGKCLIVNCDMAEVDAISHNLKPEGLLLDVGNVTSIEDANDLLKLMGRWPTL